MYRVPFMPSTIFKCSFCVSNPLYSDITTTFQPNVSHPVQHTRCITLPSCSTFQLVLKVSWQSGKFMDVWCTYRVLRFQTIYPYLADKYCKQLTLYNPLRQESFCWLESWFCTYVEERGTIQIWFWVRVKTSKERKDFDHNNWWCCSRRWRETG